jgi:cyclic pyranopterin phosphate synthase
MLDITHKEIKVRKASASGEIILKKSTIKAIREGKIKKGDPLLVAQVSAITAIKNTPQIIPMCHNIPITKGEVKFNIKEESIGVRVNVVGEAKTGVEIESLVGVSVALNTIWDMVKELEKSEKGDYPKTRITNIKVIKKEIL